MAHVNPYFGINFTYDFWKDHSGVGPHAASFRDDPAENYTGTIMIASMVFFLLINKTLSLSVPEHLKKNRLKAWKWQNIATSFLHSVISGVIAIICFFKEPEMLQDLVEVRYPLAYALICFSTGYFIYDAFDMSINNPGRQTNELNLHHFCAVVGLGINIIARRYYGFALFLLSTEVNNVFLHLRQLLRMNNYNKTDNFYRANSIVYVGSYLVFKFLNFSWLAYFLYHNGEAAPKHVYIWSCFGTGVIALINTIHFFRLIRTDFGCQMTMKKTPAVTGTKCD